jgi:hypothetical protein
MTEREDADDFRFHGDAPVRLVLTDSYVVAPGGIPAFEAAAARDARVETLVRLLRAREWSPTGGPEGRECDDCGRFQSEGHARDCELARAIEGRDG